MEKTLKTANEIYQAYRKKIELNQYIKEPSFVCMGKIQDDYYNMSKPPCSRLYFMSPKVMGKFPLPKESFKLSALRDFSINYSRSFIKHLMSDSEIEPLKTRKRTQLKFRSNLRQEHYHETPNSEFSFGLFKEPPKIKNVVYDSLKNSFKNCSTFTPFKVKTRKLSIPIKPKFGIFGQIMPKRFGTAGKYITTQKRSAIQTCTRKSRTFLTMLNFAHSTQGKYSKL